jgi:hypothetical protein
MKPHTKNIKNLPKKKQRTEDYSPMRFSNVRQRMVYIFTGKPKERAVARARL